MFTALTTDRFDAWLDGLDDETAREAIAGRIVRATAGNFGDHKRFAGGLAEMRIHYGPGYRLYFTLRGRDLIVLLCGGSKRTQRRDIRAAEAMLEDLE